jgi:hypothetical protein
MHVRMPPIRGRSNGKRIKVWLNFVRAKLGDLITRAIAVYKGLKNNPHFTNLPFGIEELQALIDAFRASNTEAMDGSTQARAQRNSDREVLVAKMRILAHYVEDIRPATLITGLTPGATYAFQARALLCLLNRGRRNWNLQPAEDVWDFLCFLLNHLQCMWHPLANQVLKPVAFASTKSSRIAWVDFYDSTGRIG